MEVFANAEKILSSKVCIIFWKLLEKFCGCKKKILDYQQVHTFKWKIRMNPAKKFFKNVLWGKEDFLDKVEHDVYFHVSN